MNWKDPYYSFFSFNNIKNQKEAISMLARLVNIHMFRCNNKILFVTSNFGAWFIGQILFTNWLGLVLFWIC